MNEVCYSSPVFPAKQVSTAFITEVDSDLNIYFRVVPENGKQPIQRVNEAIVNANIQPARIREEFPIGKSCTAKSVKKGYWQRAVIESVNYLNHEEIFLVRFVDYGTVEMVNKAFLSSDVIMPEIPKLALRGFLYTLKLGDPNNGNESELYQKFRECLVDQTVDIRWENFLAQFFPMKITIKLPGRGVFKPLSQEIEQRRTNDVPSTPRRIADTLHALRASRLSLNGSVNRNGSTDNIVAPIVRTSLASNNASRAESTLSLRQQLSVTHSTRPKTVDAVSTESLASKPSNADENEFARPKASNTESTMSVRPKTRVPVNIKKLAALCNKTKPQVPAASASPDVSTSTEATPQAPVVMENEAKKLSRVPSEVTELLHVIAKSPFQEFHPPLMSNVFYPVVICEHIEENYCFLQSMPIETPTNDEELSITIRHTQFMSIVEKMRSNANGFNLVDEFPPFGLGVCALFDDDEWYRAVVINTSPDGQKLKVLYVDYGNTREVRYRQLRTLPDEYIVALPSHTFLVKLHNIRPSRNQIWTDKHSETLRQALADINGSLVAVFSQSGYPLEVDIYEASDFSDRVPCKHPLQKLVASGDFEFVTTPLV